MNKYPLKKLGDICDILDNKRKPVTQSDRIPGPYPYYGATGILDYVSEYIFDEKLILIGEDGAKWGSGENTAFTAEGKYWVNNHAHVIRPHHDTVCDDWIIYFLNITDLIEHVTGVTVPKLNQGKLREILIPLPPLSTQLDIVARLDSAMAEIETLRRETESALASSRELWESTLASAFRTKGNDWEYSTVEELMKNDILYKIQDGNHGEIHPTRKDYVSSGTPFIMASDLNKGSVDLINCKFISKAIANGLRIGFSKDGDILLSHKATIGRVALLRTDLEYVILTPQITYYRIKDSSRLENRYLYYFFQSNGFQKELYGHAEGGSTRAYIGIIKQGKLHICFPKSLAEQSRIVAHLDAVRTETERLEKLYTEKLASLDELKRSVLREAFS